MLTLGICLTRQVRKGGSLDDWSIRYLFSMPSLPTYIAKHNRRPILLERFLHSSLLCNVLQGLVVCISGARTRRIIRLLRNAPTTVQNFKQSIEMKIEKRMEL